MHIQISLHAHPKYLIATNIGAFLLSVLVLFVLFRVPLLLSTLAFTLLVIAAAAAFGAEIWLWFARGIRLVEIDGSRLSLYAGSSLRERSFERSAIQRSRVRRGIGRRTVILKPRSGKTVRIREDAFPREEFTRFVHFIRDWR